MSAESNKVRESLVDQLSSFEQRLDGRIDDVRLLADIEDGLGRLVGASQGNEAEIRRVLQERYESGNLRKETFQLVKSMLDRFVSEDIPTAGMAPRKQEPAAEPVAADPEPVQSIAEAARDLDAGKADHGATTVLDETNPGKNVSADDRVQVGSVLRDRFMLQERVSGGSMGVVYKALDRLLSESGTSNPYVAVKVLSPKLASNAQALRALQQEAAKGRCLSHPNIVRCIDLDRDEDLYFIVMEWLEGRTLADILDDPDTGKLEPGRAYEIVEQIGKALSYAHRCGIVHADVKPGNIMIMPNGDAKLFDFGVARVRQKQVEETQGFDPGVMGLLTPAYSSMQVLTGEDPTPSDDVFSLACLLYRLLTGYRVFGPRNAAEAAEEGMAPQRPQGLSDARWKVLKKALSYSRVARYATMPEFVEALAAESNETVSLTVPMRDNLDHIDESHGSATWIVALLVLLGLLGGAAWQFGLIDGLKERLEPVIAGLMSPNTNAMPEPDVDAAGDARPAEPPPPSAAGIELLEEIEVSTRPYVSTFLPGASAPGTDTVSMPEMTASPDQPEAEPEPALVDFSTLPPPTAELRIDLNGRRTDSASVTLREGGEAVTVDVIREDVEFPLRLRLEEVGFSGNRSPWVSEQFVIIGGDILEYPAGQSHARVTLRMTSDPVREADQQSTLRVREVDAATSELAMLTVNLEDDDQRAFEATLPANTVAFASSQISVRERDPAVQIDIQRFNPDNSRMVVKYSLRDITATQGEDYFAPGNDTIVFGPGQRTARILIPLVQDSALEDNEAFSIALEMSDAVPSAGVYRNTAVIIRDDDS